MANPAWDHKHFVIGTDDGSESAHTIGTIDANGSIQANTIFFLRIAISNNSNSSSLTPTLYCSYNSGSYFAVNSNDRKFDFSVIPLILP